VDLDQRVGPARRLEAEPSGARALPGFERPCGEVAVGGGGGGAAFAVFDEVGDTAARVERTQRGDGLCGRGRRGGEDRR
jgi:hypothetical protein